MEITKELLEYLFELDETIPQKLRWKNRLRRGSNIKIGMPAGALLKNGKYKIKLEGKYYYNEDFVNILLNNSSLIIIDEFFNKSGGLIYKNIKRISKENIKEIEKLTHFLQFNPNINQRLIAIKQGYKEHPICPICNKNYVSYNSDRQKLFSICCSKECMHKHIKNKNNSYLNKYKLIEKIPSKQETIKFFENNLSEFLKGTFYGYLLLKKFPEYKKALNEYTTFKGKDTGKIHELLNGIKTCKYCDKRTYFKSLKNGFGDLCIEHRNKQISRKVAEDKVKKALDLLNSFEKISEYQILKIPNKLNDNFILKHNKCGGSFNIKLASKLKNYNLRCKICENNIISNPEIDIVNWLKNYNVKIEQQFKIKNKRIDIFLPNYNLCIEHHGLMDHSYGKSSYKRFHNFESENSNKHLHRLELCERNGYTLFQIFGNEWKNEIKKEIWKSLILSKINKNYKISLEECSLVELDKKSIKEFFNNNHLKGYVKSNYNCGYVINNEIMLAMIFKQIKENLYEMSYCFKNYFEIVDGIRELLNHFKTIFVNKDIIFKKDKRWDEIDIENFGFILKSKNLPSCYYFKKENKLFTENYFNKRYKHLELYNQKLSMKENMYNNGYRSIYDAGYDIYQWNNNYV